MSLVTGEEVSQLWEDIKARIKAQGFNLPLFRALDAAVPIALDGNQLAIGYEAEAYSQSTLLEVPQHKNLIQRVLQSLPQPVELFIVEGTTLQDYLNAKERQIAASAAMREVLQARVERQSTEQILQEAAHRFHQRYQVLIGRGLPQIRARFLLECLGELVEVEERIMKVEHEEDQVKQKQFARVLDRLAGMVEMPSTLVALEYLRYKEQHRGGGG